MDSLRVIVIDIDTALLKGLEDYVISVRRIFRGKKSIPQLWLWVPDHCSGFYQNNMLSSVKMVDYLLIGQFHTGDYLPNQVLLFSRSVKTLLPLREAKKCQTIVGDSLQVLESWNAVFTGEFRFDLSTSQREYLLYRRKSKIYQYLKFPGGVAMKTRPGVDDLNKGLWFQERCEGVAIVDNGCSLVATSKMAIEEWENIIRKELEFIPDKVVEKESGSAAKSKSKTRDRIESLAGAGGGSAKKGVGVLAGTEITPDGGKQSRERSGTSATSSERYHDLEYSTSRVESPSGGRRKLELPKDDQGDVDSTQPQDRDVPKVMNKSKSEQELEMAILISMQEQEAKDKAEADALAAAVSASVQQERESATTPLGPSGESVELVD